MSRPNTAPNLTFIVDPDKDDVRALVQNNHYSGKCPGIKYAFGITDRSGGLVGAVVYSQPASYTLCNGVCGNLFTDIVIELSRLVITTTEPNAASVLVGRSLGGLTNHVVVSYADCNDHVGHVGYVYQATNWLYTGQGSAEPVWLHPTTGEVISYTRRHIDDKAERHGLKWTDLIKSGTVGKHRYVTFTGTKKFKKTARKFLCYKVLPYPKGATKRHNRTVLIVAEAKPCVDSTPPPPTVLR